MKKNIALYLVAAATFAAGYYLGAEKTRDSNRASDLNNSSAPAERGVAQSAPANGADVNFCENMYSRTSLEELMTSADRSKNVPLPDVASLLAYHRIIKMLPELNDEDFMKLFAHDEHLVIGQADRLTIHQKKLLEDEATRRLAHIDPADTKANGDLSYFIGALRPFDQKLIQAVATSELETSYKGGLIADALRSWQTSPADLHAYSAYVIENFNGKARDELLGAYLLASVDSDPQKTFDQFWSWRTGGQMGDEAFYIGSIIFSYEKKGLGDLVDFLNVNAPRIATFNAIEFDVSASFRRDGANAAPFVLKIQSPDLRDRIAFQLYSNMHEKSPKDAEEFLSVIGESNESLAKAIAKKQGEFDRLPATSPKL